MERPWRAGTPQGNGKRAHNKLNTSWTDFSCLLTTSPTLLPSPSKAVNFGGLFLRQQTKKQRGHSDLWYAEHAPQYSQYIRAFMCDVPAESMEHVDGDFPLYQRYSFATEPFKRGKYDFGTSRKRYLRNKDGLLTKCVLQANNDTDIARHYKEIPFTHAEFVNGETHKVKLDVFNFSRLLHQKSYWFFGQYAGATNWIQFDLDNKPSEAEKYKEYVPKLRQACDDLGCAPVCTLSPGDSFDGEYRRGMYVWIKLPGMYSLEDRAKLHQWIRRTYGLEVEETVYEGRNIRLPQKYVARCDWDGTLQVDETSTPAVISDFSAAWEKAVPVPANAIARILASPDIEVPEDKPVTKGRKKKAPKEKPAPWDGTGVNPNAFYRMVGRKKHGDSILSPIIRKYNGRPEAFAKIVHDACERYRDVCANTPYQDTISNPPALFDIAERATKVMLRTYDRSKGRVLNEAKEAADMERFQKSARLSRMSFLALSIFKNVPMLIRAKFWSLYEKLNQWHGRLSKEIVYSFNRGILSFREWKRYRGVFEKLFTVVDAHAPGKCTQYIVVDEEQHVNHGEQSEPKQASISSEMYIVTQGAQQRFSTAQTLLSWINATEDIDEHTLCDR